MELRKQHLRVHYFTNKDQLRTAVSATSTARSLVMEALINLEVSSLRADVVLRAISDAPESELTQETTSSISGLHTSLVVLF